MSTPSGFTRQDPVESTTAVHHRMDYAQQSILTSSCTTSSASSSPVLTIDFPHQHSAQPPDIDVMAQLASQFYSFESRNRSQSAPVLPQPSLHSCTWHYDTPPLDTFSLNMAPTPAVMETQLGVSGAPMYLPSAAITTNTSLSIGSSLLEPENEPINSPEKNVLVLEEDPTSNLLPATFLRTICNQLEFYFCDENLLGDLFLLKNMNEEGYVKLELIATFGRIKRLTTEMDQIRSALELSTRLIMDETQTMVCRKELLPPTQTYHGKLARTAIAYNLPEDASVASLREIFTTCGEITYIRLLKQNTSTGQNAVLKPPIVAGETYLIIEYLDEEMTKHAVLTLSDAYNTPTGMQVVLFDGTTSEKLKLKMFPVDMVQDRRRAKSTSAVPPRPVHVDAVGEGLEHLREGKVNTGTVYSIRGAGGLITPTRLDDSACISFRLIPDEDGNFDIRAGDYVSFTVGKNKKSGRKYASKVKLEFRPPSSEDKDYFSPSTTRWESRNRSATVGAAPPAFKRAVTTSAIPPPSLFRGRSGSTGTRPKLNLTSPRVSTSSTASSTPPTSNGSISSANGAYRQAIGPDGTRGFGARRTGDVAEMFTTLKMSPPAFERRRSSSNSAMMR